MAIVVTCECGRTLTAPDDAAGRRGRCPFCGCVRLMIKLGSATRGMPTAKDEAPPPVDVTLIESLLSLLNHAQQPTHANPRAAAAAT